MTEQVFHPIRLLAKKMLTPDVMELRFERPDNFHFIAGQFVQFMVPDSGGYVLRSYSISSVETEPYIEFCVKILPGGKASQLFSNINEGSVVQISAAKGVFVCHPSHGTQKVFIATGVGLAPVIAMAESWSVQNKNESTHLLFGVRLPEDIFWQERLQGLQNKQSNFEFHISLTQPDANWSGWIGRVTEHVAKYPVAADYYICGSLPMVKDVRKILLDRGVNTKSIHFEIF